MFGTTTLQRWDEVLDALAAEDVALGSDEQIGANVVELRKRVDCLDAECQPARRLRAIWLRRLVVARDQHCRMPGCDQPAGWCVAHHIVFWGNGGPTQLDNLVLLCRSCHNDIHLGGWALRLEADGTVVATSPDGIEYTDPPPGHADPALPLAGEERAVYRVRDPVRTRTPARAGPRRVA